MSDIAKQVKTAKRVGTPLVVINTPDPAATVVSAMAAIGGEAPLIEWDFIRGMTGRNDPGKSLVADLGDSDPTINYPTGALVVAAKLPEDATIFVHLADRWIGEPSFIQAAWNLRDQFKANGRMVVFLAKQLRLPAELSDDVLVLDEPLPTAAQLEEIVRQQHKNAEDLAITDADAEKAVEALRGLSAFCAEQITAMSLTKAGINLDGLWERKRQAIEQTPGLRVFRGGESFAAIGGCSVIKSFLQRIMRGHARPNAVVFVDEIEKMIGGTGDTSGVSQDQLGSLLSYMQDHSAAGMIFVGPPGAAKSAVAKAAGNEGGVPTIQLDLGAAKGSLVGQSEQQLRQALKVITAVSNGASLWIATCNAITALPPELRRRFTLGTYFFDLPTADERKMIWSIWTKKHQLDEQQLPLDESWTGAEIRQCCDIAWRLGCTLIEAAQFVVPVARSAPDKLEALRAQASDRFLSASYPGVYQRATSLAVPKAEPGGRKLTLAE